MSAQVRCLNPQCGFYFVNDFPKSAYLSRPPSGGAIFFRGLLASLAVFGLSVYFDFQAGPAHLSLEELPHDQAVARVIAFSLTALSGVVFLGGIVLAVRAKTIASQTPKVVIHDYYCQTCGYHWTWREDQPPPKAPAAYNPNSALIEAVQQRDEQNKAAYWIIQQRDHPHD